MQGYGAILGDSEWFFAQVFENSQAALGTDYESC